MKRTLAVLVALLVVGAGCGSHRGAAPFVPATGTLPPATTAPSTTVAQAPVSPTTTIDTSRVPARITVAYVDAVLKVLDNVAGNAVRSAVAAHNLTEVALRDLAAVYPVGLRSTTAGYLLQDIQQFYSRFKQPPGNLVVTVRKLVHASPTCIFASVHTDFSAVSRLATFHPVAEYLALRRAPHAGPSTNPTGWLITFDRTTTTDQGIADRCAG